MWHTARDAARSSKKAAKAFYRNQQQISIRVSF
jgi:hypothetical protein